MTVETNVSKAQFNGSGSVGPFTFDFRFFQNSDICAIKASSTGVEMILTEGVDYTLSGAGSYAGGSLTLDSALAAGESLVVIRTLDLTQPTSFRNQGAFYPETHEDALDRLLMLVQQLSESTGRTLKLPISTSLSLSLLPTITPGGLMAWNQAGDGIEYLLSAPAYTSTTVSASAYGADLSSAIAAVGSANITLVVDSPITVNDNIATHVNTTLVLQKPGILSIASGKTLTINGPFSAGRVLAFAGDGMIVFGEGSIPAAKPEWWGAYSDETHSAETAASIQKAMDAFPVVEFGGSKCTYLIEGITTLDTWGAFFVCLSANNGQRFIGNGATVKCIDPTAHNMISIEAVSNIEIAGVSFVMGGVQNSESVVCIRLASGCTRINIHHCSFDQMYIGIAAQVETATVGAINIHHNVFNSMGNLAIGINSRNAFGIKITDNYFSHCGHAQIGQDPTLIAGAVELRGNYAPIVANNHFYECTDNTNANDAIRLENITPIPAEGVEAVKGRKAIITGNVIIGVTGNGIDNRGNDESLITGNIIIGCTDVTSGDGYSGNGIVCLVTDSVVPDSNMQITNNYISGCSYGISETGGDAGISKVSISQNKIDGCVVGLYLGIANSCDISQNNIENTSAELFYIYSGSDNVIKNNVFRNGGLARPVLVSTTDSIWKDNYIIDNRDTIIHEYGMSVGAVTGNKLIDNIIEGIKSGADFGTLFLEATIGRAGTECRQKRSVPTISAQGSKGDWAEDDNYIYYCTATTQYAPYTWSRVAKTAWTV